jgi:P27 family predicted phage terminase small subunit
LFREVHSILRNARGFGIMKSKGVCVGMNPKKPTKLKILEGNPGKRTIDVNEVCPLPARDECPMWLAPDAQEVWKELFKPLDGLGLMTELDYVEFVNLCIQVSLIRRAYRCLKDADLTEPGSRGAHARPELKVLNEATVLASRIAAKFGMSPVDRVGLVDPRANEKSSKISKLLST